MNELLRGPARWWRLDPDSHLQVSLEDVNEDLEFSRDYRFISRSRSCISIREVRRNHPGWAPDLIYGPWKVFDLVPLEDGVYAVTTIEAGGQTLRVRAYEAPTLGTWTADDDYEYMERAA